MLADWGEKLRSLCARRKPGASSNTARAPFPESLTFPAGASSEEVAAQLRARQVDAIRRLGVPLMVVNLVNISAMLIELWIAAQLSVLAVAWSGVVAVNATWSLALAWRARNRPAPKTTSRRTVRRVVRSAAIFGLLWSVPGLFILPHLTGMALAFGTTLLTGMIAGGAIVLFPIPAAATAFLLPVSISAVIGILLTFGWLALGPAILATAFLWVFLGVVRRHSELFVSEFIARLQLEQRSRLVEDLLEDARLEVLGAKRLKPTGATPAEKTQAIGQLVAGLAHDFNNIFAAIQGNAELLALEDRADPTLLDPIRQGCVRGADEMRQLVAAAQKQLLRPAPVPLAPLVADVANWARALDSRLTVGVDIAPGTNSPLADAEALRKALESLARNASEAMPDGGHLRIQCRNAPGAHPAVEIAVTDTGQGMSEATRQTACDPFFTTGAVGQHRGLGLSGVEGFARQSSGQLRIESGLGVGTTVTITLPCPPKTGRSPRATPPTVLLVERDEAVRSLAVHELQTQGYSVPTARDAEAAIHYIEKRPVDLVLSNILPSDTITCVQLAHIVRQMPGEIAIAFYSDWSKPNIPAGAADSAGAGELSAFVAAALNKGRSARE